MQCLAHYHLLTMTTTQVKKPRRARRRKPKIMTEETFTVKKPAEVVLPKPTDNIIPFQSYVQDAKNRWKVHQYEIKELRKDLKWSYDKLMPYLDKVRTRFSK